MSRGRLYVGTSGFSYPGWIGRFYDLGLRSEELLAFYAKRLNAVELNNTFYQQPKPKRIAAWLYATPPDFRFVLNAPRGGSMRAFGTAAAETVAWLTAPYRLFGRRLGAVLFRVPDNVRRDDDRLRALLEAWPDDLPLVAEFQHASWHSDEVYALLAAHGTTLCSTDLDDGDPPDLRLTGRFTYLRLRRMTYTDDELRRWADRLGPFLDAGTDCYDFFRHDEDGASALRALELSRLLTAAP